MRGAYRIAIAAGLAIVTAAVAPAAQPELYCGNPNRALGVMLNPDSVVQTFTIQNRGNADLVLGTLRTSCGCLDARLSHRVLNPGEIATVTVTFDVSSRSGPQEMLVELPSNDPGQPVLRMTLTGEVRRDIVRNPRWVTLREITGQAPSDVTVTLESATGKPFQIETIDTDAAPFCRVSPTTVEDGYAYSLLFRVAPDAPLEPGRYTGTVRVGTDHPDYARIDIPVSLFVRNELMVSPPSIVLRPTQAVAVRYVLVRSLMGRPCEVVDVTMPGPGQSFDTRVLKPSEHRIALRGLKPARNLAGRPVRIVMRDADGTEQVVEVPVELKF
jgi:hypothetical protein